MHGNIWEWCADAWYASDLGAPSDGSVWKFGEDDTVRWLRGGCWYDSPWLCRSANRLMSDAAVSPEYFGFRVSVSS